MGITSPLSQITTALVSDEVLDSPIAMYGNQFSQLGIITDSGDIDRFKISAATRGYPIDGSSAALRTTVAIAASASDDSGVTMVTFLVDGTTVCADPVAPYTCSWKVSGKRGRTHQLQVIAQDAAGNSSAASVSLISH